MPVGERRLVTRHSRPHTVRRGARDPVGEALENALMRRGEPATVVIHSDRGYTTSASPQVADSRIRVSGSDSGRWPVTGSASPNSLARHTVTSTSPTTRLAKTTSAHHYEISSPSNAAGKPLPQWGRHARRQECARSYSAPQRPRKARSRTKGGLAELTILWLDLPSGVYEDAECSMSLMVELRGIEPLTSSLRTKRSTN